MTDATIIRNLRRLMAERGVTQKRLAILAGLGETAVRDILAAKSKNPRIATIQALARALRCTVEEIISTNPEELVLSETNSLDLPIVNAKLYTLEEVGRLIAGEKPNNNGKKTVPVPYLHAEIVAVRVASTAMSRVMPQGSVAVIDFTDRDLVDRRIYALAFNLTTVIRRYRDSDGPPRFEPDSPEDHPTLYPGTDDEVTVFGRVVRVIQEV